MDIWVIRAIFLGTGTYLYSRYVTSQKKLSWKLRCRINRVCFLASCCAFLASCFGVFRYTPRIAHEVFYYSFYWLVYIVLSTCTADGWCCRECGQRVGIQSLYRNSCPYCEKTNKLRKL